MTQERLNLYLIDIKYVRNLHQTDDRVSSVSPQIGKQHRIYVGVVVICNKRKYLIPLSHPVDKHKKMRSRADFDKIIDKKGKLIGVLNYNLMIPVKDSQIKRVDLEKKRTDTFPEKHYKDLCIDELNWCRTNQEIIVNKANVLYSLCTEHSNYAGKLRCLDFKKMEAICDKYGSKYFYVRKIVEEDGSITLCADDLDLVVNDNNEESAKKKMAENIKEYAEEFNSDYSYWSEDPKRKLHIPYVSKAITLDIESIKNIIVIRN